MFKLFTRQFTFDETFSSLLYDEKSFYNAFEKDLKNAQISIVIESPYLTLKRAKQFAKVISARSKQGVQIKIYTRNPKHHDQLLENQALLALKILKSSDARIILCDDMRHRKLAIIDGQILWEGSLNILSQANSREIMRRTLSKDQCNMVTKFTGLSVV